MPHKRSCKPARQGLPGRPFFNYGSMLIHRMAPPVFDASRSKANYKRLFLMHQQIAQKYYYYKGKYIRINQ
jgi:hypothetical protein